jgi:hypothetical protein
VDFDKPKSPLIPDEITEKDLELGLRVQLKTLTPENAEMVARHLAMVGLLIDQDPELAHQHALAAAGRAARIALVRETVGITAYTVGDFAVALRELLTFRRISGSNDQLPASVGLVAQIVRLSLVVPSIAQPCFLVFELTSRSPCLERDWTWERMNSPWLNFRFLNSTLKRFSNTQFHCFMHIQTPSKFSARMPNQSAGRISLSAPRLL